MLNSRRPLIPGSNPNGRGERKVEVPAEMKFGKSGKTYTTEALNRAHNDCAFVATRAENLFRAWWEKRAFKWWRLSPSKQGCEAALDRCYEVAEILRAKTDKHTTTLLEKYDAEVRGRTASSNIIIPDAGQVADMFPKGHFPGIDKHHG